VLVQSDREEFRRCSEGTRRYGRESFLICSWVVEANGRQVLNGENPFILVHSPLVSNYDLTPMIDAHKKRREVDKNFIMTMGVGRGGRYVYKS
jgi:hypothetical protein